MADDAQLISAAQEVIHLWPEGPPDPLANVGPETVYLWPAAGRPDTQMLRNVTDPTLTVFTPEAGKGNGVGVVVAPGGGWRILAWEHEGVELAHWLAERGYTAFLLKYRVRGTVVDPEAFAAGIPAANTQLNAARPAAEAPRSLMGMITDEKTNKAIAAAATDGHRALEIIRERAGDWGVDPARIGMIGFSAGAFLTVDLAMNPQGPPLAFIAPIYGGETRGRPVPANAPPLFTCIAGDDRLLFRVVEGLYFDWSNADVESEIHVFRRGQHGFGMVKQGLPSDRWIELFEAWLRDLGFA
jgi:acetyl esterase/lipase